MQRAQRDGGAALGAAHVEPAEDVALLEDEQRGHVENDEMEDELQKLMAADREREEKLAEEEKKKEEEERPKTADVDPKSLQGRLKSMKGAVTNSEEHQAKKLEEKIVERKTKIRGLFGRA